MINGIGGLGKTELAKYFFYKENDYYEACGWINYFSSLKESIVNEIIMENEVDGEDIYQKYRRRFNYLEKLDEKSILIIDNLNNEEEYDLPDLRKLKCKVIVTSRYKLNGFTYFDLDFLKLEECQKIFSLNYTLECHSDLEIINKIIELAGYHTLTIEILAKTAYQSKQKLNDFYELLKKRGLKYSREKTSILWHNDLRKRNIIEHLRIIFDISSLNSEELNILINLSLLPAKYLKLNRISSLIDINNKEIFNKLIEKGWLKEFYDPKTKEFFIFMHNIIQEVVKNNIKINQESITTLLFNIISDLNFPIETNPIIKRDSLEFGISIANTITNNNILFAFLYLNLSHVCYAIGYLETGLKYAYKSMNIYNNLDKFEMKNFAMLHLIISQIYNNMRKLSKAIEYGQKALKIAMNCYDDNNYKLAQYLNTLSLIYKDIGDYELSLDYQQKCLNIKLKNLEENNQDLAVSYNNLSLIYMKLGNLKKALEYSIKDVDITEKTVDLNHPNLAQSYNTISLVYLDLRNYSKAKDFQEKSIKIREEIFDVDHIDLAHSYNNMGLIFINLTEYDKALEFLHKSLKIRNNILPNSQDISQSYNNIAMTYHKMGLFDDALKYLFKSLKINLNLKDLDIMEIAINYDNLATAHSCENCHPFL